MKILSRILALVLLLFGTFITNVYAYSERTYDNGHNSYNRQAAKTYIEKWVDGYNPAYANFTADGGDCTNFVSQVLRAGGIAFTSRSNSPTNSHWYYYDSSWGMGRTSTWTHAHYFREHFGDVNDSGLKRSYQMRVYEPTEIYNASLTNSSSAWFNLYNNIGVGDVVQYTSTSSWQTYHGQVVQRKSVGEEQANLPKLSMAQHTSNSYQNLRTYIRALANPQGEDLAIVTVIRLKSSTT